jgi:hypothetical protein
MDNTKSLDILIFCFVCLLLIISVISYWFGLKTIEPFSKCPTLKCDIDLINSRIKNAFIFIKYLEDRSNEITKNISLKNLQLQIEPYENIYLNLTSIEKKIREILDKQDTVYKVWNYAKNTKYTFQSQKLTNIDCFQIKSPEECSGTAITTVLKNMTSKIEEISYQTELYYYYIAIIQKMTDSYNAERKKALTDGSAQANKLMSNVLGIPINIDLSKNFDSPTDPAILDAAKTGNPAALAKMALANPDMIRKTSSINPSEAAKNTEKMFDKNGPNSGGSFGNTGNNLVSNGMNNSKDPEKAQEKYKSGQQKINMPPGFM